MRRAWVLPVALLLAFGIVSAGPECDPVFVVGDLHGGYEGFVTILKRTGLVDETLAWTGGGACLVQLGDIVDRGPRSREILDLLIRLEAEAWGRVQVLLGNHEIMNIIGDLRYLSDGEVAAFAGEETEKQRQEGFRDFLAGEVADGLDRATALEVFGEAYPAGWFAHRHAFSPAGQYGAWLLERPVAVRVNDSLFVHGGLTAEDAAEGLRRINADVQRELKSYFRLRDRLARAGWLSPLSPYLAAFEIVDRRLVEINSAPMLGGHDDAIRAAREFLQLSSATCVRSNGPVWHRDLAQADESAFEAELQQILVALGVNRVVVGHTTTDDGCIRSRFDGRVFLVDTGTGPAYGGNASALEIAKSGVVSAVYPDRREVLVEPRVTDPEIERFLSEAPVVDSEEIGSGISRPKRLVLEQNGRRMRAAFKTIDVQNVGRTRFKGRVAELNFTDKFIYERAAYLLDRELDMDMVPVTVIREIDGELGTVMEWVEDAIDEHERRERELMPEDPLVLIRQRDVMQVFDALILNADRHLSNELITLDDWKLHLIDHSRAFRLSKDLPAGYEEVPISLPRPLYERLGALDEKRLVPLMRGLLSKAQVKALLARRDKILRKVEADRNRYSDAMVFHPPR